MKREFLKELGLEDEQVDKIMAENGKDIEKAKDDLSTKETELADTKKLLEDANKEIEDFKELDIEEIKTRADDYKDKFEKAEIKAKEDLDKIKFEHRLESALTGAKAKNIKAVKGLLDIDGLKLNGDDIVGLSEQVEKLKEDNDYLFESEKQEDIPPTFTRPGGNRNTKDTPELTYSQMLKMEQNK